MKILMFLIFFLLVGAFFIVSNQDIPLDSQKNVGFFFKEYKIWLNSLVDNGGTVLGYVVKMEWLPNEGVV